MADGVNKIMSVSLRADIHDLKLGLDQTKASIKTLTKEFKASTEGLDNWKKDEVGLEEKIKQLNSTLELQNAAVEKTTKVYEDSKRELGETHHVTQKYYNMMKDWEAAQAKTNKQLNNYKKTLDQIKEANKQAANETNEFKNAIENMDASINEANAEFNLATARMEDWENSTEGIQAKIKQLNKVFDVQKKKLSTLKEEYEKVSREQGENSTEAKKLRTQYLNQQAAVDKTEKELESYNKQLDQMSKKSKKTKKSLEELDKATDNVSEGFTIMRGAMSQIISSAIIGLIESIGAAISSSKELRKELGMLNAAAITTGSSFDDAKKNLIEVSSITDDTGAAVEGLNNLMTAGFDGKALNDITDLLVGASIKWKDTLKFEGLSDGLQETLATGEAIGPFAEMLERAGVNLDVFNAGLTASYDPAKKQQYILNTLAKLGLKEVKDEYESLNESLIENNEAIINQQVAMAGLNEALEPLQTMLINFGTAFIDKVTPGIKAFSETAQKFLGGDFKGTLVDLTTFVEYAVDKVWKTLSNLAQELPGKIAEMSGEIVDLIGSVLATSSTWKFDLAGVLIEALNNILDVLPTILEQIVQGIDKFLPQVIDAILGLADLIVEVAPEILKKIISILPGIVSQITQLLQDNLPVIIEGIKSLVDSIIELLPQLITMITEALPGIIQLIADFIVDNTPLIMDAIVQLILKIVDAIPMLFDLLVVQLPHLINVIIEALIDAFPEIIKALNTIFWKLIEALPMLWSQIVDNIPQLITSVINAFTMHLGDFISIGGSIVQSFIEGIISSVGSMITGVGDFVDETVKAFKKFFGIGEGGFQNSQLYKIGKSIISGLINGITSLFTKTFDTFIELGDGILGKFADLPGELGEIGKNLLTGMWQGIKDKTEWLKKKIQGIGKDIIKWFKNIFDEHSPSRVMRNEVGKNLDLGIGLGITDSTDAVLKNVQTFSNKLKNGISSKLATIQGGLSINPSAVSGSTSTISNVNNFTQIINAPKQPSRIELYRQTKNLLAMRGGH